MEAESGQAWGGATKKGNESSSIRQDRSSSPSRKPTSISPNSGSRGNVLAARCWGRDTALRFERGGAPSWPCLSVVLASQQTYINLSIEWPPERFNGSAYASRQIVLRARVIGIHKVLIGREAFLAHAAAGVEAEGFFYDCVLEVVVSLGCSVTSCYDLRSRGDSRPEQMLAECWGLGWRFVVPS
jgi:hypothetical protein